MLFQNRSAKDFLLRKDSLRPEGDIAQAIKGGKLSPQVTDEVKTLRKTLALEPHTVMTERASQLKYLETLLL